MSPDGHTCTDDDVSEYGGASTKGDAISDGGMPLAAVHRLTRRTQRHVVQHVNVAADNRSAPNHHSRSVVNHDPRTDLRSRVYVNRKQRSSERLQP
eukprot:scaffold5980_cov145-Isochrysis_galbana.AAC.7